LSNAGVSKKSRTPHRRDPSKRILGRTLHRGGDRSRNAQRQRSVRSRPGVGSVFFFVILSGPQRSRRISKSLSARPGPVVMLKSQATREKQRDPSLTSWRFLDCAWNDK